jgi:hypothetical protein
LFVSSGSHRAPISCSHSALLFHRLMVLFDRLIDSFDSCDCLLTRVAPIPRTRSLICACVVGGLVHGPTIA